MHCDSHQVSVAVNCYVGSSCVLPIISDERRPSDQSAGRNLHCTSHEAIGITASASAHRMPLLISQTARIPCLHELVDNTTSLRHDVCATRLYRNKHDKVRCSAVHPLATAANGNETSPRRTLDTYI